MEVKGTRRAAHAARGRDSISRFFVRPDQRAQSHPSGTPVPFGMTHSLGPPLIATAGWAECSFGVANRDIRPCDSLR